MGKEKGVKERHCSDCNKFDRCKPFVNNPSCWFYEPKLADDNKSALKMLEEFKKLADELMKMEEEATFSKEHIQVWIEELEEAKDEFEPLPCPCEVIAIRYNYTLEDNCFYKKAKIEWEKRVPNGFYCYTECERSEVYEKMQDIVHDVKRNEEIYDACYDYLIEQLKKLL